MIYRMRTYKADPERLASSHEVFFNQVLPVHCKHGARFIGRWQTEDNRIVVLWEYDSEEACRRIQDAVAQDPQLVAAGDDRRAQGLLGAEVDEVLMTSTAPEQFEKERLFEQVNAIRDGD